MIPTVPQTPVDAERLALIEHLARGVHAVAWLVACAIVLLGTTTATAAEIELQTAAGISGIVFDRSTNAPVDSFEVTVHVTGRQAHTDTFRDSGGRFAMVLPDEQRPSKSAQAGMRVGRERLARTPRRAYS